MIQWIVTGLGNPGSQYQITRHNAGFMAVEAAAQRLGAGKWKPEKKLAALAAEINGILLLKPQTFMNRSGQAVAQAARFYKLPLERIIVVHDDLDIPMGMMKTGFGKGPKVHNGLESVEAQLGSKAFWRVRIGIDNRTPVDRAQVLPTDYVLKPLTEKELHLLVGVMQEAVDRINEIVKQSDAVILE